MGGDPTQDQSAGPGRAGDRPLGPGRRVRPRRTRSRATPSSSSSATGERYAFLRWGQGAFDNFRVVPPDTGIVPPGQPRVPRAGSCSSTTRTGGPRYPDTLVGTDSHTTMVNGLGVLGWGVGGIEAEAAMLGQPMSMLIPQVVGFKLDRRAARGRHRHRPGADGHRDAPPARRRRQVRRVLRDGPGEAPARGPGHDRQHVARVRLDRARSSRSTPRRSVTCEFSGRPRSRSSWSRRTRASRGCGTTRIRGADVHRAARARPRDRGAQHRRAQASPGQGLADRVEGGVPEALDGLLPDERRRGRGARGELPGQRSGLDLRPNGDGHEPIGEPAASRSPSGRAPQRRSRSPTEPRPSSTTATW